MPASRRRKPDHNPKLHRQSPFAAPAADQQQNLAYGLKRPAALLAKIHHTSKPPLSTDQPVHGPPQAGSILRKGGNSRVVQASRPRKPGFAGRLHSVRCRAASAAASRRAVGGKFCGRIRQVNRPANFVLAGLVRFSNWDNVGSSGASHDAAVSTPCPDLFRASTSWPPRSPKARKT
jgi:hypothetical protein